jgi:beta-glucosidase
MGNINSLYISDSQTKLANALLDLKKPTIVIYVGGRPRIISDIVNRSNAVLIGFLPGTVESLKNLNEKLIKVHVLM